MTLQADLQAAGWYLSQEGIDQCCQGLTNPSVKDVIKKAVDLDFKEVGRPCLPEDINRGHTQCEQLCQSCKQTRCEVTCGPTVQHSYHSCWNCVKGLDEAELRMDTGEDL